MNESLLTQRITDAAARIAGLELVRISESNGQFAAVFEVSPNPTYFKYINTKRYTNPFELLSAVLDTLEHLVDKEIDMNIFSAEMFEYLCAEMLPGDGRPVTLTIKATIEETVAGPRGEQTKVIVHFVERPKKLILNKTNARTLARALGNETDEWHGARVTLGVESVKVGRNIVPSIRVTAATARPRQHPQNGNGRDWRDTAPTYADGSPVSPAALDGYRDYLAANDNQPPADVRALIAWQQGDGQQDDLFGQADNLIQETRAALATAQGQLD